MSDLPFVASAVHQCVRSPVEQSVLGLGRAQPERARSVVRATTPVRAVERAELRVARRAPTATAPHRARHQHARGAGTARGTPRTPSRMRGTPGRAISQRVNKQCEMSLQYLEQKNLEVWYDLKLPKELSALSEQIYNCKV